jgi:anti-anti-sigma regulatory factor
MFSNEPAIRDDGAHVVVMLRGELDIANAADLGAVLSEAVARNLHVIADL